MGASWPLISLLLVAACDIHYGSPDAGVPDVDRYTPPSYCTCSAIPTQHASCRDGVAKTLYDCYSNGGGTHSMCYQKFAEDTAQCASGCSVVGELRLDEFRPEMKPFMAKADVMCAGTPEAQVGDYCDSSGSFPCMPTRAQLDTDGTVAGQNYLACQSNHCIAVAAPIVPQYLEACAATTLTQYGKPDVNGAVPGIVTLGDACLLAWDSTASRITSGRTRACIGDWQCPAGALCDDIIANLTSSGYVSVCKPGPRGVLTPAMLSP